MIDVAVTTDGGFTGRGIGWIEIRGTRAMTDRGESELTPEERATIESLADAFDHRVRPEDKSTGYPDQVRTTVRVGRTSVSFRDDAPADVRALHDAVWRVRERIAHGG